MTAIVGVLNSQGIAIAADSAVTVSGKNGKKVYNRSNKIFTLSKYHPVGIAIYNSADFLGIPLETLVKLYRSKIKDKPFDTLTEYKEDFLEFAKSKVKHISPEYKRDAFYGFCSESYNTIKDKILERLETRAVELKGLTEADAEKIIDSAVLTEIEAQYKLINEYSKAKYISITLEEFTKYYQNELHDIEVYIENSLQEKYSFSTLKANHISLLREVFYSLINVEFIFERYCGLAFVGFGEEEIYPSSQLVLLGTLIADIPRVRYFDSIAIIPGVLNSNILPYVQGDVTNAVLTGVDPNYKSEVVDSIKLAFQTISEEIGNIIGDSAQSKRIVEIVNKTSDELIRQMDEYQFNTITGPLLEILAHMGKEDMSELAESLVNITSLKRKFTSSDSSDESVGGPVDVAIITKGDGFVWMKRKQYFDIKDNKGFIDKYYKL